MNFLSAILYITDVEMQLVMSTHNKLAAAAVHNHSDLRGGRDSPSLLPFFGKPRGPFDFLMKLHVCLT